MVSNGSKQIMYRRARRAEIGATRYDHPRARMDLLCRQATIGRRQPGAGVVPGEQPVKAAPRPTSRRPITPKTKWVVLNFPNNPTGAVCSRTPKRRTIRRFVLAHPHVLVMADDCVRAPTYDGSLLHHRRDRAELKERLHVTVNGASKARCMTGIVSQLGFAAVAERSMIAAHDEMQARSA